MANTFIYRLILCIAVFAVRPIVSLAGDGVVPRFTSSAAIYRMRMASDTIPPPKKPVEGDAEPDKTKQDIIKEVPKARKQVKPVALPAVPVVPVKPIKIIKPKIIKRIL